MFAIQNGRSNPVRISLNRSEKDKLMEYSQTGALASRRLSSVCPLPPPPQSPLLLLPYSQFFPNSRVIDYIKYRLRFSMFDNVNDAVYSDYFVGWITGRKPRRRMFQIIRP